jgi:serine/threonine-protein kinase RsbW
MPQHLRCGDGGLLPRGLTRRLYKLRVSSSADAAVRVQSEVLACLAAYGYEERDIFAIELALQEAVTNAVRHGNRNNPTKSVRVGLLVCAHGVWIRVADQGAGFDPSSVPDPTLPENLQRENGRGVFLMRQLMDDVSFNRRGNAVTMVRKRLRREDQP